MQLGADATPFDTIVMKLSIMWSVDIQKFSVNRDYDDLQLFVLSLPQWPHVHTSHRIYAIKSWDNCNAQSLSFPSSRDANNVNKSNNGSAMVNYIW